MERAKRKQSGGKTRQVQFGPRVQNQIQSYLLMVLASIDGFPQKPWKHLSTREKRPMLKMVTALPHLVRYLTTWHNPPVTFALNEPDTMTLNMWRKQCRKRLPSVPDSDPIKSGFFSVNMKYARAVLLEEFAKWLTHFEGKAMSETPPITKEIAATKKAPGRRSIRDALNALAVMRLRYHCNSFAEAKAKMEPLKKKSYGLFYQRRDAANRARTLGLGHFHELFGWLDPVNPIHFTEGWRGGL